MQNTINSDLIRGNINTIILKSLFEGDRYGYDIINEIEQKSSGQYVIKQPTLYSCLKRLEVQGFIKSYWGAKTSGGRRKYYTLTELGRELFIKNQTEWEYSRTVIDKLISDREYDMSKIEADYQSSNPLAVTKVTNDTESWTEDEFNKLEEANDKESSSITEDEDEEIHSNDNFNIKYQEPAHTYNEYNAQNTKTVAFETIIDHDKTEKITIQCDNNNEVESNLVYDNNKYIDTSNVLNKLFNEHNEANNSYTAKLENDKYVAKAKSSNTCYSSEDYFNDTFDSDDSEDVAVVQNSSDTNRNDFYTPPTSPTQISEQQSPLSNIFNSSRTETIPKEKSPTEGFLTYKTSSNSTASNDIHNLERDYRKILFTLLKDQTNDMGIEEPNEKSYSAITINGSNQANKYSSQSEPTRTPINTFTQQHNSDLERSIDDITTSVQELGENIYIRTHSRQPAKEHSNKYYYFSNKLMLHQSIILFAIMAVMTCFTFLIMRVALGVFNGYIDLWCYILAISSAVALPLTSTFINYYNPDKRKLINYRFNASIRFRLLISLNMLVIVYLVNIYLGMPLGFSSQYATTLLLPALYTLCIPISGLIFHNLFTSGRYSARQ